jgi:hypothetical protein
MNENLIVSSIKQQSKRKKSTSSKLQIIKEDKLESEFINQSVTQPFKLFGMGKSISHIKKTSENLSNSTSKSKLILDNSLAKLQSKSRFDTKKSKDNFLKTPDKSMKGKVFNHQILGGDR